MAEQEYDDSLLDTTENMAGVDWDSVEGGGLAGEGKHLAIVKKVGGQMKNFGVGESKGNKYTGAQAVIMFQILEGSEKGKTVYERIALPHPEEEQWKVNKRLLVASRMGLVPKGSKDTIKVNWKVLEGRTVLITVEHYTYEKDGNKKTGARLTFDGWEDPANAAAPPAAAAGQAAPTYADI